jgi:two-component system cell cycle response regulator DivK
LASKLILHIEDNPSNRKVVQHILRRTDYSLIEAVDGEQGLELAFSEKPDLILMDMQLPRLSGFEVAKKLKADERSKQIPVIALTAYALNGDDIKAREAGCDDYISKPFRPAILLEGMAKFLDASYHDPEST